MEKIKKFYLWLVNIGISKEPCLTKKKQIKIINIHSLIWIHSSILFSIYDYILNAYTHLRITSYVITIVSMCFIIYFNHLQKNNLAKTTWLTYACISLVVFSVYIEPGIHLEYFLLLLPAASLCFFSQNKISYVLIPVTIFLFCIPYYIIPVYSKIVIDKLEIIIEIVFSICTFLMVFYFKTLNLSNEQLLLVEKDKVLSDKIILEQQQKELQTLTEFKSHFFVNLSHEIRTPLTLIKGYRDELDFNKNEDDNKQYINIIDEQLKEITNITDNILDLSKLDEHKIILNKEQQSINYFLTKIYTDFKPLFDQKNIAFDINLLEKDIDVFFDFDLMSRSITNIINNALKFTQKNGTVILATKYNNNKDFTIIIEDNGIGIAKEELHKVFDRFYQTKNHINNSKGSGIGLAFTKGIIDEHGFYISVKSKLNKGTSFKIIIEKNLLFTSIDSKLESNVVSNLHPKTNSINKTILLVDDHAQMRFYIKGLLKEYYVIEAENGKQALEILKTTNIDLLITDYMMPVMDGWVLVKKIKQLQYTFPVFVITARIDSQGKLDMLRLGIDNYFTKPFHKEELIISINKAFGYYEVIKNEATKSNKDTGKETIEFKNLIYEIINKNMMNYNFGVEDIATIFNISSKTLTRKTKLLFGQTPNQLIIEYKLLKAKEILDHNSESKIKDIAKIVGFKNASYLRKRFKGRFEK